MPSPTEQVSSETSSTPLPIKDGMEISQENVSHVNPDDGNETTNLDNNKVQEEEQQHQQQQQQPQPQQQQQQQQQPQQPQQQPQPPQQQSQQESNTTTTTTNTNTSATITSTNVATLETSSSPPHMTPIVNEDVNENAPLTSSPNDPNNNTTQDTTHEISQDSTKDISKDPSNSQKRRYTKRPAKEDPQPRRRTRNTSKAAIPTISTSQDDEPLNLASRRPSSASTSRRGTSSSNVDHVERQLPSKEGINQTNISDRFVEFIMYCNPLAPENLDKVALVRSFNAVPKSDGKVFQTWTLYQLVDKHYAGEIRTWTKLAQKLGVVRTPEASPQKIQQYAVRLKKWMASVHVDAYFDYLLSRPNDYYQMPQRNPTDASDDESDVVLKLIKRAGSKRQKRKYTRRNTNASSTSANDDGTTNPEGVSRGNTTELDDDTHFESEDEGADKHRGKRARASYSDDGSEEEDDKDPWSMDIDVDDEEHERPSESTGTNQIQNQNQNQPQNQNQRRKSVVQDQSKKKQEPIQTLPPGQTVLDLRQPPMAPQPSIRPPRNFANTNIPNDQQQQFTDGKNYAEMLLPSVLPSNDKETITILQKNLVSAVGMLEDSQRKIKMLNDLVRQREDNVRQRVVQALKNEVNTVIEKFQ